MTFKPSRFLHHGCQKKNGDYVIIVENRSAVKPFASSYDVYMGPIDRMQRFKAEKCSSIREGAISYHLPNGTHPSYVFFPKTADQGIPYVSYHQEMLGPSIETIYPANIDDIIGKMGDRDRLDIDVVLQAPYLR